MTRPAPSAESPTDESKRRAEQATEILRYWRASLRYEEALSSTPRARRPSDAAPGPLNLAQPVAGQDYMKLPFAGSERLLLEQRGPCKQSLDNERLAFFEHWLAGKYRQTEDESRVAHFAVFPVLHSPREELFGLLRFPVELVWWSGAQRFEVPTPAERRAPITREPPSELELSALEPGSETAPPYFVDLRLLRETLRVDTEALDAFCVVLRKEPAPSGAQLIAALCQLLSTSIEAEAKEEEGAPAPNPPIEPSSEPALYLDRLHGLVVRRLRQIGSRYRAFPVALVVANERSRTTWHVQRDLEQAISQLSNDGLRKESPLGAYLSGSAAAGRGQVCLGRWPHAPLTESQRLALEQALGSSFTAVQGPPGTGKTTVILNLVAHQLIEKCRTLADSGVMADDFVLVTSTNNRAVDNVVEALSVDPFGEVPLCLRLGHRAMMEKGSAKTLERVHAWLSRQTEPVDGSELATAKQAFSAALARVELETSSVSDAYEQAAQLAAFLEVKPVLVRLGSLAARQEAEQQAAERVAALVGQADPAADGSGTVPSSAVTAPPWRSSPKVAALATAGLLRAFDKLAEQCEEAGTGVIGRVVAQYGRLQTRELAALTSALGASAVLAAAPSDEASLEDWEDFLVDVVSPLISLGRALERLVESERAAEQLGMLEARLAKPAEAPAASAADADFGVLFQRAQELRTVWLRQNRSAILHSLQQAIAQCKNLHSLRPLLDSPKAVGGWLRQLFPSLGCTLLSLGNALKAEPPSCRRVVIDEAGQCPSAYAVSALLRARSALLIGDVHQLEPVVGLSREDEQRIVRGLALTLPSERLDPYRMFDESGNSAQSVADRAVQERPTLRDHFRCQPAIIALPEAWCGYGMTVRTKPRSRRAQAPRLFAAALFQDCPGEQQRFAGSWVNPTEIDQVVAWLGYLLQQGIPAAEIGVITPFRSQAEALSRSLSAARIPLSRPFEEEEHSDNLDLFGGHTVRGGVAVGTVHRFQGGERSIILFSSTLSGASSLRFVDERVNLLNVAVSRAKEHLLVIGHEATLRSGRHTRLLVSGAERTQGF